MEPDNTSIGGKNEPPQRKNLGKDGMISFLLGIFQIVAGLFLKSSAYIADGLNVLVGFPLLLSRKKAVFGYVLCFVFLALSFGISVVSFFDTSAVLDYFSGCVSILAIPASFLSLFFKVIIRMIRKNEGKDVSKNTFDIVSSLLIAVSVFLTYFVDFYFEPVLALALSTYVFAYLIEKISYIASETKKEKLQSVSEDIH